MSDRITASSVKAEMDNRFTSLEAKLDLILKASTPVTTPEVTTPEVTTTTGKIRVEDDRKVKTATDGVAKMLCNSTVDAFKAASLYEYPEGWSNRKIAEHSLKNNYVPEGFGIGSGYRDKLPEAVAAGQAKAKADGKPVI